MPGLTGAHSGRKRHARLVAEETYGAVPGGPSWSPIPYLGDGFKIEATSEPFEADTNYGGGIDSVVNIQHKQDVAGDLTTLLWPQILGALLDAALARDGNDDLPSFAWQHYTPIETRQFVGCAARTLRLQVNRTEGADAQLTIGWLGQQESVVTGVTPGDFDYSGIDQRPFMGCDVAMIQVNGAESYDVDQFTVNVDNVMEAGPYWPKTNPAQRVIHHIEVGDRTISIDLTRMHRSAQFNAARRAATTLSFYARFTHPLGHVFELRLPRLVVPGSSEDGTPSRVARETPRLLARGTVEGGDAIEYGVDLAAGGTTTVGGYMTTAAPATTAEPTTTGG